MDGPPLVTTSRQDPRPHPPRFPSFFYVLSLNSHFSGCRPEKRGPVTLDCAALRLHTVPPIVPAKARRSRGQRVPATHLRCDNESTFHFYMRHLKPSLHE